MRRQTPVNGQLERRNRADHFQQNVALGPGETRTVRFTPSEFPQLRVVHPKIWWPAQMGAPNLARAVVANLCNGDEVSDSANDSVRDSRDNFRSGRARAIGMFRGQWREDSDPGAGWAPDMLLRESAERLKTEFRYCPRFESERDPPGREDGDGGVFQSGGRAGRAGDGGMELLRLLGAMGEMEARAIWRSRRRRCDRKLCGCGAIRACWRG